MSRLLLLVFLLVILVVPTAGASRSLLIVAPEALAAELESYVAFKNARLPTQLVTLETALDRDGADDSERLKRFLYDAWRSGDLGYVLLVGDADVLPVRYMVLDRKTEPAFHYAFYPSDLYYADLARPDGSFDDWNARKDGFHGGYFGEVRGEHNKDGPINFDAIDYRPDVALGRWPVSTPEHVRIVAEKSMAYERAVEAGKIPTRAAMVFVDGWVDTRSRMDAWAESLPEPWTVEKRYDKESAGSTAPPREPEIVRLLSDGIGLMVHTGHGSDNTWHQSLTAGAIASLDNAGRTPIIMSVGCSTARFATLPPYEPYADIRGVEHPGANHGQVFDAPPPPPSCYATGPYNLTGLGERLVRDGPTGAVAYIGCNTGSQPCALTLAEGFIGAMSEHARLGDCWSAAIDHYYDAENLATIEPTESWYPASIFFQAMKFMLFGDPSLPMARTHRAAP